MSGLLICARTYSKCTYYDEKLHLAYCIGMTTLSGSEIVRYSLPTNGFPFASSSLPIQLPEPEAEHKPINDGLLELEILDSWPVLR